VSEEVFVIDEHDRYGRLRLIPWWRQEKLAEAKVLVVGAGALGNEVLKNLALIGVGRIFIIDLDTIEATNLTRSVLFRSSDEGAPKAERAAKALKDLNPDVRVRPLHGNVMTDLGLGVFAEVDVIVGCLDNREARLWINRQAWKVGRPWVDGAIQEINGVAKVFVPPDSACYECAMTEADYRLINLRYSCPLLRREDYAEGKVPTAPTISSIVAGLQSQETLKLIHGLPVEAGTAMVFNGIANQFYKTRFQRRDDCLSHETYGDVQDVALGSSDSVEAFLQEVGAKELLLDRDLLISFRCGKCDVYREVLQPVVVTSLQEGKCEKCGELMATERASRVEENSPLARRTLREVGVAPFDNGLVIELSLFFPRDFAPGVMRKRKAGRGIAVLLGFDFAGHVHPDFAAPLMEGPHQHAAEFPRHIASRVNNDILQRLFPEVDMKVVRLDGGLRFHLAILVFRQDQPLRGFRNPQLLDDLNSFVRHCPTR